MKMRLTKNEKKVLRLLLQDARMSDSTIAAKLKISGQAVGKIRKKLEGNLIESYTVNLNYARLGVQVFVISLSKITQDGMHRGQLEVEEMLKAAPNIISVYRLPNSNYTHIILYGFDSVDGMDDFFHSAHNREHLHRFIEHKELFTFSHNSLVKTDPAALFNKMIEDIESPLKRFGMKELDHFKRRLNEG